MPTHAYKQKKNRDRESMVEYLLDKGCDVNVCEIKKNANNNNDNNSNECMKYKIHRTALMWAIVKKHKKVIRAFIIWEEFLNKLKNENIYKKYTQYDWNVTNENNQNTLELMNLHCSDFINLCQRMEKLATLHNRQKEQT